MGVMVVKEDMTPPAVYVEGRSEQPPEPTWPTGDAGATPAPRLTSPVVGGCAQDGVIPAATATIVEGSEFSPRIRRILEAQPLSPLRRAVLSGPVAPSPVSAPVTFYGAYDDALLQNMAKNVPSVTTSVPLTYTPQPEEEVVVKQSSLP